MTRDIHITLHRSFHFSSEELKEKLSQSSKKDVSKEDIIDEAVQQAFDKLEAEVRIFYNSTRDFISFFVDIDEEFENNVNS